MSSIVWNFFERPVTQVDTVPCPLCKICLTYKGTTSGLMKHLKGKHPVEYQVCLEMQGSTEQNRPPTETPQSHLAMAFCSGRIPFSFAENPEFLKFCKSMNPTVEIPSPLNLRSVVDNFISGHGQNVMRVVQGLKNFALITDQFGEEDGGNERLSLHISFVDPTTFERQTLFLSILDCQSHIEGILSKYQLKVEDCIGTICDVGQETIVGNLENLPCAGMIINEIMERFWFPNKGSLSPDLSFYDDVVNAYKGITDCNRGRDEIRFSRNSNLHDSSTGSTREELYNSLGRCKIQKWGSEFIICQKFLLNELILRSGRYYQRDISIAPDLYAKVEQVVNLLRPLYNVLEDLSKESSFTSDIVPSLLSAKEDLDGDADMKLRLAGHIQDKMSFYLSKDQILIAMLCDPRFAYCPDLIVPKTWKDAEELLLKREASSFSEMLTPKKESSSHPRASGVGGLLKRKLNYEESEKTLSSELLHYQAIISSHRPEHNSNPLQFWKTQQNSFPKMTKIAVKYLTFMATTSPAERLYTKNLGSKICQVDIGDDLYKMGNGVMMEKFKPEPVINNYLVPSPENVFQYAPDDLEQPVEVDYAAMWGVKLEAGDI